MGVGEGVITVKGGGRGACVRRRRDTAKTNYEES